jgi:hypothetical protein
MIGADVTDAEYAYLVASHGDAVPPRDRLRLHPSQVPALDSLLRVMHEMGIDREVRITRIFARASGRTYIEKKFETTVDGNRRFDLEIAFLLFEANFMGCALGEFDDDH